MPRVPSPSNFITIRVSLGEGMGKMRNTRNCQYCVGIKSNLNLSLTLTQFQRTQYPFVDNNIQASPKDILLQLCIHLSMTMECAIGLTVGAHYKCCCFAVTVTAASWDRIRVNFSKLLDAYNQFAELTPIISQTP